MVSNRGPFVVRHNTSLTLGLHMSVIGNGLRLAFGQNYRRTWEISIHYADVVATWCERGVILLINTGSP